MARPTMPQAAPRRMTRSQSRDQEDPVAQNGQVGKSAKQNAGFGKAGSSGECLFTVQWSIML